MRNRVKRILVLMLAFMMVLLSAGCGEKGSEAKETVTVYAFVPVDWIDTYVWAWKDGGEDAYAEWPGKAMEIGTYSFILSVPGWVDHLVFSTEGGSIQTADIAIEPGKDVWVLVFDDLSVEVYYEDIFEGVEDMEYVSPYAEDPIYQAAEQGDFETVKSLLPTLEDRSLLTDWAFNDFNYAYAAESILNGDYETAIEFFNYCAYEDYHQYSVILQQLLAGDVEGACDTKMAMDFTTLESDLDMTWAEIVCMVTGVPADPESIDYILMEEYLNRRMWNNQPSFSEDSLVFGEHSTWEAEGYVAEFTGNDYYIAVDDLKGLYSRCGTEPNGKILVLRAQKAYSNGKTYYAIDKLTMGYLSYDLYPANLGEVEYIILAEYSYDVEGKYKQTFGSGSNSVVDYFSFLRVKGRVQLLDSNGKTIEKSQWVKGTGDVEAHFSDLSYQCSNMPETGVHIISFVEKVRQLNSNQG